MVYNAPAVSFSIPQRGKLNFQVVGGHSGGIRAVDTSGKSDKQYEFGLPWSEMEQVFCLPVPEKQKRAWNYIVIPKGNDGISAAESGAPEQVVWTYQELSAKEAAADPSAPAEPDHTLVLLDKYLKPFGKSVVTPEDDEFASAVPQLHRKGEKAYHVKAFRGSKEGYLFFLPTGILWGFKKPLTFFAFASIASISYTSVLQRTFNLVVTTNPRSEGGDAGQEIEFSMLDQQDFAGIDAYIKGHGLNDASLAKERAAKLYHVNKDKGAKGANAMEDGAEANGDANAEEDDGMTELQRAEQQIQDEEDDEEEDYDPGSEGESEGEGGSDEEEEYEGGEGDEEMVEEDGAEGEEDVEEYDEEEEEEVEEENGVAQPPAVVSGGFAVINGSGRPPPDEPEDGFL